MAPDAVVRLVERASEIGSLVGEREAVTLPQVLQAVLRIALRGIGVHRHQAHEIQFLRRLEQHAGAVLFPAFGRCRRPVGIARRAFDLVGVGDLVFAPFSNLPGELQFGGKGVAVGRRILRLHFVQGVALDEKALYRIQRRELVVAGGERPSFGFDAEEFRDEVLEMGRKRDEELGFRFCGWRGFSRLDEAIPQPCIEKSEKRRVQAQQSVAPIEIAEPEAE